MKDVLNGTVAVVTGASSGIGHAIASSLASQGVTICAVGRRFPASGEFLRQTPSTIRKYKADLTLEEDIRRLAHMVRRDFDRIDILIHSAAAIHHGSVQEGDVATLDLQYQVNVRSPFLLTQLLLPMLREVQGQVVFINSSVGLTTKNPTVAQYASTKHALRAIADSLREEVNSEGIRVLSVYPGRTATPGQEELHRLEGKTYHPEMLLQPDDVASVVVHALMLPRTAEVTDISIRPMIKS